MAKKTKANNMKYAGKYIAMPSFNIKTVIASGRNPEAVVSRAKKKGYSSPVVDYVPGKKEFNFY